MATIPFEISIFDAAKIVDSLRQQARREREDAEGKIHNTKISRLEYAAALEEIAERVEQWEWAERERQNAAGSRMRRFPTLT